MDRIHMIFFALGFFLNFQIEAQQNSIAFLMSILHYQQAFLRVAAVFRRRRFRNPPWSWTLSLAGRKFEVLEAAYLVSIYTFIE